MRTSNYPARLALAAVIAAAAIPVSTAFAKETINQADANRIVGTFKASGYSLAEAIKAAESHANGTAVCAKAMPMGKEGTTTAPAVDVTVLDRSGALKCVIIDVSDKKVLAMTDYSEGRGYSDTKVKPHDSTSMAAGALRADEVIGNRVVNLQGESVGKIEDLALDPELGRVAYAVVSFGGLAGIGEKYFAVPWTAFEAHGESKCVLNVSKETLKDAPGFDKSKWPDMNDLAWNQTVYKYYDEEPYWNRPSRYRTDRTPDRMRPAIYRANDVIGMKVVNPSKDNLGEVEELVLEPHTGDVLYVVVGVGGFLGMGEHDVAVPWSALHYDSTQKALSLNADKDQLKNTPAIEKGKWPNWNDETWEADVNRRFPPYRYREP